MENTLSIKVALQIQKPVSEVFEAIVDPKHMTQYFISESSGRMVEGKTVFWSFPEFEGTDPVQVGKIEKDQLNDYTKRKGMSLEEATRWLRPILE